MSQEEKQSSGGISFGNISAGGNANVNLTNVAGGDQITTIHAAEGAMVAAGGSTISVPADFGEQLAKWKAEMAAEVAKLPDVDEDDKDDLLDALAKIEKEATKQADRVKQGDEAEPQRLERLMNGVGGISPQIFDVAVRSLSTPLGGLGIATQ